MAGSLPAAELERVRRILFVRSDRIGDAIVSTPALQALRTRFPDAEIDVVLGRKNASAAPLLPFVDRVLIADNAIAIARSIQAMRRRGYDIAINPLRSRSTTATLLTKGAGAQITIGCGAASERPYDVTLQQPDAPTHFVRRYMLPLVALGIAMPEDDAIRLTVTLAQEAREQARLLVGARSTASLVMINISSSSRDKFWGIDNFVQLAQALEADDRNLRVVAAPGDEDLLRMIGTQSGARTLPPRSSLADFAGLLSCADMVVSPDTSVVHLAAALGKPVVALEPTARNVIEWHPWGVPYRALAHGSGIPDIPVADVAEAVRSLASEVF